MPYICDKCADPKAATTPSIMFSRNFNDAMTRKLKRYCHACFAAIEKFAADKPPVPETDSFCVEDWEIVERTAVSKFPVELCNERDQLYYHWDHLTGTIGVAAYGQPAAMHPITSPRGLELVAKFERIVAAITQAYPEHAQVISPPEVEGGVIVTLAELANVRENLRLAFHERGELETAEHFIQMLEARAKLPEITAKAKGEKHG